MNDHLDEDLWDAFRAEADRARPAPDAWARVAGRLGTRRRPPAALLLAAAAVLVLALVGAVLAQADDGDQRVDTVEQPTPPSTTPPPDPDEDPDVPSMPARPSEPPPVLAALTEDGRLVVVDTTTGEELRELHRKEDRRQPRPEGGPYVIDSVALAPSGESVWFGTCCEPISGSVFRVPVYGGVEPEQTANFGYDPTFATSSRWVGVVDVFRGFSLLGSDRHWHSDRWQGEYQELALSRDGQRVVLRVASEVGQLAVLRFDELPSTPEAPSPEPDVLPGDGWRLPSFRRDGGLVVAERAGDTWIGRVLDLTTGEVAESFDYEGVPLDQDHDPSGEWLLTVVAASDDASGTIRWTGPDGSTGTVPGRFFRASW